MITEKVQIEEDEVAALMSAAKAGEPVDPDAFIAAKQRKAAKEELETLRAYGEKRSAIEARLAEIDIEDQSLKAKVDDLAEREHDGHFEAALEAIASSVKAYFDLVHAHNRETYQLRAWSKKLETTKAQALDDLAELDGDHSRKHMGELHTADHSSDMVTVGDITVRAIGGEMYERVNNTVARAIGQSKR